MYNLNGKETGNGPGLFALFRIFRNLRAVPNGHNPNRLFLNAIKKPIWWNNDFTKRQIREFREHSARSGKFPESHQCLSCFFAKNQRGTGVFSIDVGNGRKKLCTARGSKKNSQFLISLRIKSASASTTSSSNPLPASISFSPRANIRNNSISFWVCS